MQKYFATDGLAGAYVLAVQTPTMWMDIDGNSTFNNENLTLPAKQESWYTGALWHAITSYVEGNPDVDTSRIYVGGCSNGGYMTMNMMFEHGGYFAAFYPICEAYLNDCVSDEMVQQVKDYNIWFVQSADDGTVNPAEYGLPTYVRLLEAGAQNVWFTLSDHVRGTDDPEPWSWTGTGTYDGHWSWIYAFNDQVTTRIDTAKVASVADLTPENCTVTDVNLWQWMSQLAAQRWKDAENGYPEYLPGFPEQPIEEVPANIPEPDAEWMRFYAVKRGHHPNARGGFTTTSALTMMNFPLLAHIDEISPRPILFVVGDRAHSRFFSENAYAAALEPKELYEVADAEHIDLYDRTDRIPFDKLAEFFHSNLK